MPIKRLTNIGSVGVVQDLAQSELPSEAITDALNARFLDGSIYQFLGHGPVYAGALGTPHHVMQVNVSGDRYWLYATLAKIYAVTGAGGTVVHTNLTRQTASVDVDYSAEPNRWTSTSLSGIPILNPGNATDPPQSWDLNIANRFTALPNFPANTYCRALRAYKQQLVALNVYKGGVHYPFMVKWSHPADPGAVPISWDITDPTVDAGEVDLAEGGDPIIDGMQLGGTFVIYKEQSVWRMDYAGGAFVQQFTKVRGISGAMNVNCIVEIDGFHVVLTSNDVIVHDGQSAKSVLDKRMRRRLFQLIDADNADRCFVFKNPFLNEVFICFPTAGNTVPNMALVWNYVDRTCTFREMPDLNHANYGPVEQGLSQPWSGDDAPWDEDTTTWAGGEYTPDSSRALMASDAGKLLLLDSSTSFDGVAPTSFIERRALPVGSMEQMKTITGIRPRIFGSAGDTLVIKLGGADLDPNAEPTWDAEAEFVIGETVQVDLMTTHRYPAYRIENTGGASRWRLDSLDLFWEAAGGW
jgi:hypothetical protein